jgi:hypothetical protein
MNCVLKKEEDKKVVVLTNSIEEEGCLDPKKCIKHFVIYKFFPFNMDGANRTFSSDFTEVLIK